MSSPTEPPLGQALVLGLLHGPAELLPISSSGHVAVLPSLLRWSAPGADPELRKAFEVTLHAGTAAALVIALRREVAEVVRGLGPRVIALGALSLAPPAILGLALERPIERRLGTPATVATGLIAGSLAMSWADRFPQDREASEAGPLDALLLGLAQAGALMPGISRSGATLAAARARRFTRPAASRLSRHAALPVIAGATGLKTLRLVRRGLPSRSRLPFAVGAGASFASTLGFARLIRHVERDRALAPYAVYRLAVAGLVLGRLAGRGTPAPPPAPIPPA